MKRIGKNIGIIIGIHIGFLLVAIVGLNIVTKHGKEIKVPDFTNLSVSQAQELAAKEKIQVLVTDSVYVRRMKSGAVYRQNPAAGTGVKKGRKIRLVINTVTPKMVVMPNVVGYSLRQATSEIIGSGLKVGRLKYENDFATNNVLGQKYKGEDIEAGVLLESDATIDLVLGVNKKENATAIPDLLGMRMTAAIDILHDNSLNVGRMYFDPEIQDYSDSLNAIVYRQSPDIGPDLVRLGGNISLYFTLDPTKVPERIVEEEETIKQ